jgi:hypothetical protein
MTPEPGGVGETQRPDFPRRRRASEQSVLQDRAGAASSRGNAADLAEQRVDPAEDLPVASLL